VADENSQVNPLSGVRATGDVERLDGTSGDGKGAS
jgi:hypothetical protein